MNENYLMLNGKRIDLTEEQIRTLGFETKEDYFKRGDDYYYISTSGEVMNDYESCTSSCKISNNRYNVANYCKNKDLMKQRALHETLNRLLWRFSMQNDGDKINWNNNSNNNDKYYIYLDKRYNIFDINNVIHSKGNGIYFYSKKNCTKSN